MIRLAITHFNNETLYEYLRWRENKKYEGCIYNCPVRIKENIPFMSKIYVIEMNNQTNNIVGIGLIINKIIPKLHKIYSDQNYNRYTYYGKKWLPNSCIDKETLITIEKRLFKGKNHLKRSQGIVEVPFDVKYDYLEYIDKLFKLTYQY